MSKLFVPPVKSVFRLTVEAFGNPVPSIQWTFAGLVQAFVCGLRYPEDWAGEELRPEETQASLDRCAPS